MAEMKKQPKIDGFFKRKHIEVTLSVPDYNIETIAYENRSASPRIETTDNEVDISTLERDPGIRPQIWNYPVNQRDEIRRAYINVGPYQPILSKYPKFGSVTHQRSFQSSWFKLFPSWLEYSPVKDAAFCLPCYLFNKASGHSGKNAFTLEGFQSWKKVRDGKNCSFLNHEGKDPNSPHKIAEISCLDLMNQSQHIQKVVENYSSQQIADNRLRLKATIEVVRWLAFQGCAFRGHDEKKNSINRGNFLQMLEILAAYNEKVAGVILDKAPKNASYTSPQIQNEILHVFSTKVKKAICEEIGESNFCIIVDEARDESKREQMAIVLRFVDKEGLIQERFFGLVHVSDTEALTLKKEDKDMMVQRNDELKNAQAAEIEHMIAIDELETRKGMNEIGTLQRAGDIRWDADAAYEAMTSYEFIFILHLMKELMEITNDLCQALQCQSQDIINAMNLVSSTKALIQELRDDGWDSLLTKVNSFCEAWNIDILDMNARYVARRGRARHQQDDFTIKHYYIIDIFYATIDSQLQELNSRFSDQITELLIMGSALDPREMNKSFRIDDICQLVDKFYPQDFEDHEKIGLRRQLQHFESDVVRLPEFKNLSTISDLSQWMVTTRRSTTYPPVYRVVVLVLTLPISTATAERSFSAMRIVKTRLRNKMEDEFLTDSLIMYIEREIAEKFSVDLIIDGFQDMKER
ncbi:uncharacterized protein LOC18793132 [Prunus persica]|uniref:uncharacterized protein LOC18793132 n=1 Tax=Prunus persica TaxID=3760 RepID=UPI0009AB2664|nr:uncharacterized protein LOC18793132 [Prunus persica]